MATIRAYTTIEQSRKLSEILPLESADAFYVIGKEPVDIVVIYGFVTHKHLKEQIAYKKAVPCWSLTALLDVTKKYGLIDLRFLSSTFDGRGEHLINVWCCTFDNIYTVSFDFYAGNPIEACYQMIIRLNKLNML